MNATYEMTCSVAPVQLEGTVGDKKFYFRSRWEGWRLSVADSVDEAIYVNMGMKIGWRREGDVEGGPYAASYLDHEQALQLIQQCLEDYCGESVILSPS